eukprot:13536402-Alexandrium_andersonii.AAC.1
MKARKPLASEFHDLGPARSRGTRVGGFSNTARVSRTWSKRACWKCRNTRPTPNEGVNTPGGLADLLPCHV